MAVIGHCDACTGEVHAPTTANNSPLPTRFDVLLHNGCSLPWLFQRIAAFGGFHPGFVPAGPSAANPCAQCGHKCAGEAPEGGGAAAGGTLDDGTLEALVAAWLATSHLSSLQERFTRLARDFEVRRRGAV
jgi:hypothetical protein